MFQCVLFDLDGTLTDPKEGITKCVQFALHQQGIQESNLDKLEPFIGPPLKESFMEYYGMSAEAAEKAIVDYRSRFAPVGIFENKVYQGIPEMLAKLKAAGIKLAVASSKPEVYVNRILDHFELAQYFDVVVGSLLDGKRVDKEEVVEEALRQLRELTGKAVNQETCAMVGDRKFDVYGGREHGLAAVAVAYGYACRGELEAAQPDFIAKTVKQLEAFLLGDAPKAADKKRDASPFAKTSHILSPFLLYYVIYNICYVLAAAMLRLFSGFGDGMAAWLQQNNVIVVNLAKACSMLTGAGFLFPLFRKETVNWQNGKKIPFLRIGIAVDTAAIGTNILFSTIGITGASAAYERTAQLQYQVPFFYGLLLYGLISPLAEELLFRGLIYTRMKQYFSINTAILVSSLLFGFYHGNPVQALYGTLLGILIAYLYEVTGNFIVPIFAHGIANVVVFALTYDTGVGAALGKPIYGMFFLSIAAISIFNIYRQQRK